MKLRRYISQFKALFWLHITILRNSLFHKRSRVGYKDAVPPKKVAGRILTIILIPMILLQGFFMAGQMIDACKILTHEQTYPNKILIDRDTKKDLSEGKYSAEVKIISQTVLTSSGDQSASSESLFDTYLYKVNNLRDNHGLPDITYEKIISHHTKFGSNGFYTIDDIKSLKTSHLRSSFGHKLFYLIILTLLWIISFTISSSTTVLKQQRGKDDILAYLPLRGWQTLMASYLSSSLLRILAWMSLFPIMVWSILALGYSFLLALPLAVFLTITLSSTLSGVELVFINWLRFAAPKRILNILQIISAITGIIIMYGFIGMMFNSSAIKWLLEKIVILDRDKNLLSIIFATDQPLAISLIAASSLAVVSGVLGCFLAGRIIDRGVIHSTNEQGSRTPEKDPKEKSLWEFEKLALARNRGIAAQILIIPFIFVAYQIIANPTGVSSLDFKTLCIIGFGTGAYACLITVGHLFSLEQQGLWIIQTLPQDASLYFQRRERIWRSLGACIGSFTIVFGVFWMRAFSPHELGLAALCITGLWIVGRVVNAIMIGSPKFKMNDDGSLKYTPNMSRSYLAMLVAGSFASLIHQGNLWSLVVANILFWLLGMAIWERQRNSYRYMLDPTEKAPRTWGLDTALWLTLGFFAFQIIGLIFFYAVGNIMLTILLSFVFSGIITLIIAKKLNTKMIYPLPWLTRSKCSLLTSISLATVLATACAGIAFVWLWSLEFIGIQLPDAGDVSKSYFIIILAVVAAPLIEEHIFRGKILRAMAVTWNEKKAMLVSSLLFAIIHPGYSFLPVFCLGLCCAWLYRKSGSLWPAIGAHALYNLIVVVCL